MEFLYTLFGTPLGYIMWACYKAIPIYVLALFAFTLISKVALFPFAIKTHKASIQQLVWKPRMDEIRKKYANNREKQAEEMQKLYTEEGMKMSTGCGASLIQFPILFGVIDVVYKPLTHLFHVPGDVINALATQLNVTGLDREIRIVNMIQSAPEKYLGTLGAGEANLIREIQGLDLNFLGINLGEVPTFALNLMLIIPVAAGITTILQTVLSMKMNPMSSQAGGKGIMYVMAVIFVAFTFAVPAGVGLYWCMSNVLAIVQMFILNKMYPPEATAEKMRKEIAERRKAAKKAKVAIKTADGKVIEKDVKQSELDKIRIARARELEAKLYEDADEVPQQASTPKTKKK